MPPEFRERYFTERGPLACVAPELRERTCWRVGDLLAAGQRLYADAAPGVRRSSSAAALTAETVQRIGTLGEGASGAVPEDGAAPETVSECGPWDVILFRNVAIYLNPEHTVGLWERLAEQLRPGSVLVTGKAERPPAGLPLRRLFPCIYLKNEKRTI